MMNQLRWCALVLGMLIVAAPAQGQAPAGWPRNGVFVELLGNGWLYSMNFDRKVSEQLSVRIGIAQWGSEDDMVYDPSIGSASSSTTTVPVLVNYLPGSGRGRLELGAGVLVGSRYRENRWGEPSTTSSIFSLTGGFGDPDTACPDSGLMPSVGLSVGYTF